MKKTTFIIVLVLSIFIVSILVFRTYIPFSSNPHHPSSQKIENIELNIDNVTKTFDFSSLVDSSVWIVPLENSEECLIGEITDIILKNNNIFIVDNTTKTVFIFDLQGKLQSKICKIGRGPEEYLGITACTVVDSTITIYDHISSKLNCYNMQGNFIKRIPFTGWGASMFTIGEKIYFVNNWSGSSEGYYRLFTLDLSNQQLEKYIPFSQTNRGWGIDCHYAQYKDTALVFYSSCDTIYKVTDKNISQCYYVDFLKKKLPEQKAIEDGREALQTCMKGNYISGITALNQSENLVFIQYKDNSGFYTSIYDKYNKNIITCNYMELIQNGRINLAKFKIDQNMILSYTFASDFKFLYEETYSKALYSNPAFKEKIDNLNLLIKDDSNPILFIYKIKPSIHI